MDYSIRLHGTDIETFNLQEFMEHPSYMEKPYIPSYKVKHIQKIFKNNGIKVITVTVYSDPSHAWAKVKLSKLKELNIHKNISSYSYTKGDFVYLEEDCDLGVYEQALIALHGKENIRFKFNINHTNRSSKIRSYCTYLSEWI